jgi:hypothetical protein
VFWYVRRQLRTNAELACDAWVLWALPGARRAYAEALIEVAQTLSRPAVPALAVGIGSGRRDFQRRLTMIMREQVPCRMSRLGWVLVGLLALVIIPGWSLGQPTPKNEKPKPDLPNAKPAAENYFRVDVQYPDKAPANEKPGATNARSDYDQRLQALEGQLQALLKEVHALRGQAPGHAASYPAKFTADRDVKTERKLVTGNYVAPPYYMTQTYYQTLGKEAGKDTGDSVQVLTLARATYRLPAAKAQALANFLQEQLGSEIMEVKHDKDTLTVTTTPETQKAVGQFVELMRKAKTKKSESIDKPAAS